MGRDAQPELDEKALKAGVWHKDGPLAQIETMARWAEDIAKDPYSYGVGETAGKIAKNLRAAAYLLAAGGTGERERLTEGELQAVQIVLDEVDLAVAATGAKVAYEPVEAARAKLRRLLVSPSPVSPGEER